PRPPSPRWPRPPHPARQLAEARLDRLRSADPELREGPLDLDRIARRVLLLTAGEPVTGEQRADLVRLAAAPEAGNARDLAALSARYLVERGAFDDVFRVAGPGGAPRGVNWTGTPVPAGLDLTATAVRTRPADGGTVGEPGPAPWATGPEAHLLVATGGPRVLVRGRAGFARPVDADVLAALLALDPVLIGRPQDTPVAVMVPGFADGNTAPATLAARLGRTVAATGGVPAVLTPPGRTSPVFGLLATGDPARDAFAVTPAGTPGWARDADGLPLVAADGTLTGVASVDLGPFPDLPSFTPGPHTATTPLPDGPAPTAVQVPATATEPAARVFATPVAADPAATTTVNGIPVSFADAATAGQQTTQAPHDPQAHYDTLMRSLYGPHEAPGARDALRRLNALRAGVPALRGGPLDLDPLARYVLSLNPGTTITSTDRAELMGIAMDPAVTGATRLTQLAAFHLHSKGALGAAVRFRTANGVSGVNWTGRPLTGPLDLTTVHDGVRRQDGTLVLGRPAAAGWSAGPTPYVLLADGDTDTVLVRGPHIFERRAPKEVVAELLTLDTTLKGLPSDVPLLMLTSYAATGTTVLPRGTAVALGRDVWSPSGAVVLGPLTGRPGWTGVGLDVSPSLGIVGGWLLSDPTLAPAPEPGGEEWEQQVVSVPVIGKDHRSTGHMSVSLAEQPAQLRTRTAMMTTLATATHYVHFDVATMTVSEPVEVPWRVDDPDAEPYFEAKHGLPGRSAWEVTGGQTVVTSGARTSGALGRRPSLRGKDRLVKIVCFAAEPGTSMLTGPWGAPPHNPDPLGTVSEAQQQANDGRQTVYASRRRVLTPVRGPRGEHFGVDTDPRGQEFGLDRVLPEPEGTDLDDRARAAGLHTGQGPAPDDVRALTLRLVRLVRVVFGAEVEHRPADHAILLRGAGALALMARNDQRLNGLPLFTLDLFDRVAAADHRTHAPGTPLDRAAKAQVLRRAAEHLATDPAAALSVYARIPSVTDTLRTVLARPDLDTVVSQVLLLPAGAPVGPAERSRLLWAEIRMREMQNTLLNRGGQQELDRAAATALHLPQPDPAVRDGFLRLARFAAAAGRDPFRLAEVGAYYLELGGVHAPASAIRAQDGSLIGRDHTGAPAGTLDFDATRLTLLRRAPDGSTVVDSTVPAPWYTGTVMGAASAKPWLYRAGRLDADRIDVRGAAVSHEESAELMYRDPGAANLPLGHPAVLLVPGSRPRPGDAPHDSLPGRGALLTGRPMWAAHGTPTLHTDPATGRTTVALEPDASGNPLTAADFGLIRAQDVRTPATGYAPLAQAAAAPGTTVPVAPAPPPSFTGQDRTDPTDPPPADRPWERTGPTTGRLRDTAFELHPVASPDGTLGPALAHALRTAGVTGPAVDGDPRLWAARRATDADLTGVDVPPVDGTRAVRTADLTAAGITLNPGQEMEAVMRGDQSLPLRHFTLTPVQRLRLLATDPGLAPDPAAAARAVDTAALAAAARELGLAVALVGPDGVTTEHGTGARTSVLLVDDGEGHLAGTALSDTPAPAPVLSPNLVAKAGFELELGGVTVPFYARGVVLFRGEGWRLETDTPDDPPYTRSNLEFVLDPVSDLGRAEAALRQIIGIVARMRTLATATPDRQFTLAELFDGVAGTDPAGLTRDATVTVQDLRFRTTLQATYGSGPADVGATAADLLTPQEAQRLDARTTEVTEFFAREHGRPMTPRAREFARLIVLYLERAGAAHGTIKARSVRRHVVAAFRLMTRSDFCSIRDQLLDDTDREDIDALLLVRDGHDMPGLMRALGHGPADRVFHDPYEDKDNNLNEGPTRVDWLHSIVHGRGEGAFKKDLLSPPPGFPLHTGNLDVDFGMGAMGVDAENGYFLLEARAAPYRPSSIPLNGVALPVLAREFMAAMGHNPALTTGGSTLTPRPEAVEAAGRLEELLTSLHTTPEAARRVGDQRTAFVQRTLARGLQHLHDDIGKALAHPGSAALADALPPLRTVAERLRDLQRAWLTRSQELDAVYSAFAAAVAAYETALWDAENAAAHHDALR
ncbi:MULTISPECIES: lonely Cys domain-containing protein, partial [unclassified Streptomyces]|uniref:lonely Cys domain-containing protein n=1 Tax=unclassified Streptomyces TaxID=2593676 RepID=UPI00081AF5CC